MGIIEVVGVAIDNNGVAVHQIVRCLHVIRDTTVMDEERKVAEVVAEVTGNVEFSFLLKPEKYPIHI